MALVPKWHTRFNYIVECSKGNMLQQKQQQMEEDFSKVENEFKAASMKLEETLIELKKQKAVNRSANEHNEVSAISYY